MKKSLFAVMAMLLCMTMLFTGCTGNGSSSNNKDPEKEIEENIENIKDARVSVWDGSIADSFSNGDGSQIDPYVISSAAELAYVSKLCAEGHNFSGEFLELDCNINLNGLEWDPIGKYSPRMSYEARPTNTPEFKDFQGNFDGNGYFVANYVINKNVTEDDKYENFGLFGSVRTATIQNLIVKNFKITVEGNKGCVGGLVGRCVDTSYFKNCHATSGSVSTYVIAGHMSSGGLIGSIVPDSSENEDKCATVVLDCSANTSVSVSCPINRKPQYTTSDSDEPFYMDLISYDAGGLIGSHTGTQGTTMNCFSSGSIYVSTANTEKEEDALMNSSYIGGLMAYTNSSIVKNCYSSVDIISKKDVGLEAFGGLFGMAKNATITKCYYSGELTIEKTKYHMPCGGLIGQSSCNVEDCFVVGKYIWSNTNKYNDFLIGKPQTQDVYTIDNCYVSATCRIKEMSPTGDLDRYSGEHYTVVDSDSFINKDFITNKLGFEEKPSEIVDEPYAVPDYPGWVITDGELPRMYYENTIKEETVKISEDIASFVGKKAEDAIAKFGTDYTMSGMSLYFSNAQVSFSLGNYTGTLLGTEEIVAINIGGERDLGNGISSSMTYTALKEAVKKDVPVPSYLEIDGTYILSVDIGKYTYVYTWSTENYDTEKSDYVSITKKN